MTKQHKEALEQVESEMKEEQLKELKGYFRQTLEAIEEKKAEKERVEEELRVLKLDLEDLKEGKFKKIEERQRKAPVAKKVSVVRFKGDFLYKPILQDDWYHGTWIVSAPINTWATTTDTTSGMMMTGGGEMRNKTFYF